MRRLAGRVARVLGFCSIILVLAVLSAFMILFLIAIVQQDFLQQQKALFQPCGAGQAYDSRTGQVCPKETK